MVSINIGQRTFFGPIVGFDYHGYGYGTRQYFSDEVKQVTDVVFYPYTTESANRMPVFFVRNVNPAAKCWLCGPGTATGLSGNTQHATATTPRGKRLKGPTGSVTQPPPTGQGKRTGSRDRVD